MADKELDDEWVTVSTATLKDGWYAVWHKPGKQRVIGPYLRREAELVLEENRYGFKDTPGVFEKKGDPPFEIVKSRLHRCHECGSLVPRD